MNLCSSSTTLKSIQQAQAKKNIRQIRPWLHRPKKSKFGKRRVYKYNDQHWTTQQNSKYVGFLIQYIDLFKSNPNQKRKYHLNRMASKFVGTRSPIQCRSHHQRMLKAYGTLQNIVRQINKLLSGEASIDTSVQTNEMEELQQSQLQPDEELLLYDFPLFNEKKPMSVEVSLEMFDSVNLMGNSFFDL